ncbi:type II secretion system F family protein [Nocardioides bigeumensis]|uniref:VWFA domain-containing protein n=1 Tax=Nocardioides bigeumensis TaxID=433657 RepID=A0ABP5JGV0_9ACTN
MVRSAGRAARGLLVAAVGSLMVLMGATSGTGATEESGKATISYVGVEDGALQLLVSVPPNVTVDLEGVSVTVDGEQTQSTASLTESTIDIRRTTVLAIDTSNSMKGERFAAAKAAARTFLDEVPEDVNVGIVTFDSEVATALAPTTDRGAARTVLDELTLAKKTFLYDGVLEAVALTGDEGQRSVLVLSDGADTSETDIADVTAAIGESEVLVDVVAIAQDGPALEALQSMATAGNGEVISANLDALRQAFSNQAEALASQVLVKATIPESVLATEAEVAVSLPVGTETLTASAFTTIADPQTEVVEQVFERSKGITLPSWSMYVAVGMVGIGMLVVLLAVVPGSQGTLSTEAVVARSAMGENRRAAVDNKPSREQALSQATIAAAEMLKRNAGLEGRIAKRLEAAGSHVKSAEWLLLHSAIVVVSGALGVLIGGGSIVLGMLFLALGAVLPWLWLGFRKRRRLKAFNEALPDTLQLMAGSLQAGLSLAQSVDTIVREGTEPVASEFKRVLVETRLGVSLEDALEGISDRFQSKDFGWVVMAIKIQREVGGNLAELLNTVADTMRERQYIRRQVAALAAEGKLSAWVLSALPVLFMIYLLLTKRDYVWPMFTQPLGWLMLGGAGVLLALGSFTMSKLVKVEV